MLRPRLPGPPVAVAFTIAMAENFGFWPLGRLIDRHHPARRELEPLQGNRRALAAATWRHALFGVLLGTIEQRLNADPYHSRDFSSILRPGGRRT